MSMYEKAAYLGVGVALAGSLAGCGPAAAPTENIPHPTDTPTTSESLFEVTPEELAAQRRIYDAGAAAVQGAIEDSRDYWAKRGVNTDTELVVLSATDSFDCHNRGIKPDFEVTSFDGPVYCLEDDTVVFSERHIMNLGRPDDFQPFDPNRAYALARLTGAHEHGHAVQKQLGTFDNGPITEERHVELEDEATCYAGSALGETLPEAELDLIENALRDDAEAYADPTDPEAMHRAASAQSKAFATGRQGGDC